MDWIGTSSLGTEHTDHDYDSAVTPHIDTNY